MTTDPGWIKASKSGGQGGNCVELRLDADHTDIRDSKSRDRGILTASADAWHSFLGAVKAAEIA